jgi:SAM-dependent methyltransferase
MADGGTPRKQTLAQQADLHETYEAAVQTPDAECEYILDTFRKIRGRAPQSFREDFCGTASVACEWVRGGPRRTAIGVDLDPSVLDWGQRRHLARLTPAQQQRVQLIQGDVARVKTDRVDVVGAFNFSYWVFKTRENMLRYFRRVREALNADGVFFMDAYGGYDAYKELRETTKCKGFTYVWHQKSTTP